MATCFVIQPFDNGKYDKRYRDVYRPAIEAAGLEPYRVDQDAGVLVPIDSIERGIRQASVCLADITEDNPNVWYELGYASASERPVVMLCSNERQAGKYPFDIQHRTILTYRTDSPSDFESLRFSLIDKLKAIVSSEEVLDQIANADPVAPFEGLSHPELIVLAVIAGEARLPEDGVSVHGARQDADRAGVTGMGFNLAIRRLKSKGFIRTLEMNDYSGEPYDGLAIQEAGWHWIDTNQSSFVLSRQEKKHQSNLRHNATATHNPVPDDDIPF